MHRDEPTLPSLRSSEPGEPDSLLGRTSSEASTWPLAARRDHSPSGYVQTPTLLLGISLGANIVLLVGLLSLLLLGHSGFFSPGTASTSVPPTASTHTLVLSSPTPPSTSPTPTTSPAPIFGWLQLMPSSVHLGCDNGQQIQFVVLINNGPAPVQWQVNLSVPGNQAALNISPNQGTLNPGTSMSLQIQNQTQAHGPQGVSSQQGIIDFVVDTSNAGVPPHLSYTTVGC